MKGFVAEELDCRLSIILALVVAFTVIMLTRAESFLAVSLCGVYAIVLSRRHLFTFLRRLAVLQLFLLMIIALLPFSVDGRSVFDVSVGGVTASYSWNGLVKATVIWGKAVIIFSTCWCLLGTRRPNEIGMALRRLGMPVKLTSLVFMSAQFIDELKVEYRTLRIAMMARGYAVSLSSHSLRHVGYLVGNVIVRSLDRSETVLEAMEARGFKGQFPSLNARKRLGLADSVTAVIVLTSATLAVWLEFGGAS